MIRIATFNLLHGIPVLSMSRDEFTEPPKAEAGPAGEFAGAPPVDDSLLRLAAKTLDADIVGLQEVDRHQPRSDFVDQTGVVAEAMGAPHWRFAPSLHGTPGTEAEWHPATEVDDVPPDDAVTGGPAYGVGLASRLDVVDWHIERLKGAPLSLPLMVPGQQGPRVMRIPDEPRAAIAAVIQGERGLFTVATAHLSFVPGYNARQLRDLKRRLSGLPRPLFLVGDFNLPGKWPSRITGFRSLARGATYPTFNPRVQFDHVLVDGLDPDITGVATVHSLPVSDHCALSVDIDW